jgi:hypothetical protein
MAGAYRLIVAEQMPRSGSSATITPRKPSRQPTAARSALAQWMRINVNADGEEWRDRPRVSTLTPSAARALPEVLAPFTTTPWTCYFGLWEGFGGSELPPDIQLFKSNTRVMGLFEGPIQDGTHSFSAWPGSQLANLWWPADRAWFVVSEIDYDSTIIAGSRACIDALLKASNLEVFEVGPGDTLAIS